MHKKQRNSHKEARSPNKLEESYVFLNPPSLQLIDPFTCLISNLAKGVSHEILQAHHLKPSHLHKGFIAKLNMLNSFKRSMD